MKEYIERAAVIDLITRRYELPELCTHEINSIPAADVVEVVRCKDCKYCDYKSNVIGCACFMGGLLRNTKENGYCSFGERRDDNA